MAPERPLAPGAFPYLAQEGWLQPWTSVSTTVQRAVSVVTQRNTLKQAKDFPLDIGEDGLEDLGYNPIAAEHVAPNMAEQPEDLFGSLAVSDALFRIDGQLLDALGAHPSAQLTLDERLDQ